MNASESWQFWQVDDPDLPSTPEDSASVAITVTDVNVTDTVTAAVDSVAVSGTGSGSVPGSAVTSSNT